MDPRHPELAVSRIKELIKQYDRVEKDIKAATVSNKLGELEREGSLVIQELCLTAPRLHEALIQASRNRRAELQRQPVYTEQPEETPEPVAEPTTETTAKKTTTKKTTTKKTTKKAKK